MVDFHAPSKISKLKAEYTEDSENLYDEGMGSLSQ